MITLHRLTRDQEQLLVNPDLIARVESCPDTVLRLTTGQSVYVMETPAEVSEVILAWRSQVMQGALAAAH
jgi:uncharacterized protein YlzI (FlbEa/FlbD family)